MNNTVEEHPVSPGSPVSISKLEGEVEVTAVCRDIEIESMKRGRVELSINARRGEDQYQNPNVVEVNTVNAELGFTPVKTEKMENNGVVTLRFFS